MKKTLWIAALLATGMMATACTTIWGCHNPTGYCGKNVPDPDRLGGPSWFFGATPDKRLAYYADECSSTANPKRCALSRIKLDSHDYCVLYYLPPSRPKNAAEQAQRDANYKQCRNKVLAQHDLPKV